MIPDYYTIIREAEELSRRLRKSKSWTKRVVLRVLRNTVIEIVPNRLWIVRGLPELGDKYTLYEVTSRSGKDYTCTCNLHSWGSSRKECTHIGAVMLLRKIKKIVEPGPGFEPGKLTGLQPAALDRSATPALLALTYVYYCRDLL